MATESLNPKHYEISTVDDFLKVPPDRLDDCLEDLKTYLEVKRELAGYFDFIFMLAEAEGGSIRDGVSEGPFIWIDDGNPTNQMTVEFIDTDDGGMKVEIRTQPEESD